MIYVEVVKMPEAGWKCRNTNCQHLPEYTVHVIGNTWSIKTDTVVAFISIGDRWEYYCGGCIDEIYHLIKQKLDRRLWVFQ